MNLESAEQIANAILYEGYLLYPYRSSSIKNRQRWNFGVVYPRDYSEKQGGLEPWTMRTECLVAGKPEAMLDVTVRFLHLVERTVQAPESSEASPLLQPGMDSQSREEGMERRLIYTKLALGELVKGSVRKKIEFPAWQEIETVPGPPPAEIRREQKPIGGAVIISAEKLETDLYRVSVQIENTTPDTARLSNRREGVLRQSFISTHTILQAHQANFISLLETPEAFQVAAQSCQNQNTWPVLLGSPGDFYAILSSPIILYDYPQIAPESVGPLFDGTEIDEILTLRIMTLSDAEKEELRQGDVIGRELLERIEAMTQEQFMKLHGIIRNSGPVI